MDLPLILLTLVRELNDDKVEWVGMMVDHGKRNGIKYVSKLIIWSGFDREGNRVIKYFCLDIDKSGHHLKDCASAIKYSVTKLELSGLDTSKVRFICITGNTGGGGAV